MSSTGGGKPSCSANNNHSIRGYKEYSCYVIHISIDTEDTAIFY